MKMNARCLLKYLILAICAGSLLLTAGATDAVANPNIQELQSKAADIALLKNQLGDRKQQADAVLADLTALEYEILNEIRILLKSYQISSIKDVKFHPRLKHNFDLMRQVLAYTRAFREKIRFYQSGEDKLSYLHQLVQDDLKMSTTLNHYEIDALTTQISMLIHRYLAEAHIIQIDPQHLDTPSMQEVWKAAREKHN